MVCSVRVELVWLWLLLFLVRFGLGCTPPQKVILIFNSSIPIYDIHYIGGSVSVEWPLNRFIFYLVF